MKREAEEDRWSVVRRSRSGSDEVRCGGRLGVGLCWVSSLADLFVFIHFNSRSFSF